MKKRLASMLLCSLLVLSMCFLSSCEILEGLLGEESQMKLTKITESNFLESNNPYKAVESFAMNDELGYHIFELGTIDYVPLNISDADGVAYTGTETKLEFNYKETNAEESYRLIVNTLENSVTLSTREYAEASVSIPMATMLEAGLNVGIEKNETSSITSTNKESYYSSASRETTYEKNITYKMDATDPVGYYFYTPVASVRIYEIVVYNHAEEKIEYMFPYHQVGASLPGLYYSKTSFLDFSDFEITFEEEMLPKLTMPAKRIDPNVTVDLDLKNATCDVSSLNLTLGEKYGELPTPERHGYSFAGWTCNGKDITEDSIVTSTDALVPKWEIITHAVIRIDKEIEVSSTHYFSPLHHFIPGGNGSTNANETSIDDYFDFDQLKKDGYKMKITYKSDVKKNHLAVFGLEYDVTFKSNGNTIIHLHDEIDNTSYKTSTLRSETVSLNDINGNIDFFVSTKNYFSLYMKNIEITFEFFKD